MAGYGGFRFQERDIRISIGSQVAVRVRDDSLVFIVMPTGKVQE
jgi:hypothetical protein